MCFLAEPDKGFLCFKVQYIIQYFLQYSEQVVPETQEINTQLIRKFY